MNFQTFNMSNQLEAVDPMVVSLRSEVEKVLSNDARFRFEICISEVLTNMVVHGQAQSSDALVKIKLGLKKGAALIEVFDLDGAEPFDLRNHAKDLSEIDVMAEGGRGIGLVMECADGVTYGRSGDCNSLVLEFSDERLNETHSQPSNGASE